MLSPMAWVVILFSLALASALASLFDLSDFLKRTQVIEEYDDLAAFKATVRRQMYFSLTRLVSLWGAFFIGIYGLIAGGWGTKQYAIIGGFALAVFLAVKAGKGMREQASSLPAGDKGLEGLYGAVTQVWRTKSLPDF